MREHDPRGPLRRLYGAVRDFMRGAIGADAYEQYLRHLKEAHPEQRPLSSEAFFRREFSARWEGVRRCC